MKGLKLSLYLSPCLRIHSTRFCHCLEIFFSWYTCSQKESRRPSRLPYFLLMYGSVRYETVNIVNMGENVEVKHNKDLAYG